MFNNDNNSLVKLKPEQIVSFGEVKNPETNQIEPEYYARYLYRDIKDNMIFGLCVFKTKELTYRTNDEPEISYVDMERKEKYKLRMRITDLWRALPKDDFPVNGMLSEPDDELDVDKYLLAVKPVSRPIVNNIREFFRLPLQMEIYFKEISDNNADELAETRLKFEIAQAKMFWKEAEEGVLEEEAGYSKLITADISGGGFMFTSSYLIRSGTFLECMMIVDREALPVVAKILRAKEDDILGGYNIHVQFHKISDPVRDRLVKYLIKQQRQLQKKFSHNRR